MSEHSHHDDSWNKELVHGLHEFKEALDQRDDLLKEHERQVQNVFEKIVLPVLVKFKSDAEADHLNCILKPGMNNRSQSLALPRATPNSSPYLNIEFSWSASSTEVTLRANKGGNVNDFLKHKKIGEVTHKDIADYLAIQMREVVAAEKVS